MGTEFNGNLKRIYIDENTPDVSVKGLYSDWKEWALQGTNLQYQQAFRTFGGDPTVAGQTAPAYYFLTNGWRIIVDGFDAYFGYNLYTDEGENPVITLNGGTAQLNNSDVGIVKTELDKALDYNGKIWVDGVHGTAGDEHPIGTIKTPVNNIPDALTLASIYGITDLYIEHGTFTLNNSEVLDNLKIYGSIPASCVFTFTNTGESHEDVYFENVTVQGDLTGQHIRCKETRIKNVSMLDATLNQCGFYGNIGLASSTDMTFVDCFSVMPGTAAPQLIFPGGSATTASVRRYSGGLHINNMQSAGDVITVEYVSGKCTIKNTCTDGLASIRGVVHITDESQGTVIDTSAAVGSLIDLSTATINVGDIAVDVDTAAIATATRVEMDNNSAKLNAIYTDVSGLDVTAITTGQTNILNAISGLDVKIDDIGLEVDTLNAIETNILESIGSISTLVNGLPTLAEMNAGLNIPTTIDPADIWTYSNRSLTIDPSTMTPADVWNYTNRSLTSQLEASDVWGYFDRSLTTSPSTLTASDVWTYENRSLTQAVATESLNEESLHAALDSYINKDDWKATVTSVDLTPVLTAISALNDTTAADFWAYTNRTLTDKTGFALTAQQVQDIATAVEQAILNEGDGTTIVEAIVGAISNQNVDEIALVAAIRADLERAAGPLHNIEAASANLDATISSRATAADVNVSTTVNGQFSELGLHSYLDSYLNKSDWKATETTVDIGAIALATRNEMDANSNALQAVHTEILGLQTNLQQSVVPRSEYVATKVDTLEQKIDAIPTLTYNIPDYSADFNSLQVQLNHIDNEVEAIPTQTYTIPDYSTELEEIQSQIIQTRQDVQELVIPTVEQIRSEIVDVVHGELEIENNQLVIRDGDGSVICRFNLFDAQGNPTMASVFRRERV